MNLSPPISARALFFQKLNYSIGRCGAGFQKAGVANQKIDAEPIAGRSERSAEKFFHRQGRNSAGYDVIIGNGKNPAK